MAVMEKVRSFEALVCVSRYMRSLCVHFLRAISSSDFSVYQRGRVTATLQSGRRV